MDTRLKRLLGKTYNYWRVTGIGPLDAWGHRELTVECTMCGTVSSVKRFTLRSGRSKSCGCFRRELLKKRHAHANAKIKGLR